MVGLGLGEPFEVDVAKRLSQAHHEDVSQCHLFSAGKIMQRALNWIAAWFIRIPNLDHKSKFTLLTLLQDVDLMRVKLLVYQVKKLCL
jgi:hypothetical protein